MTIKYIKPAPHHSSERTIQAVYEQIKQDFGALVEPFTLHSSLPSLLAGVWMACRETEVVGRVPRELKEAVASTVSRVNKCPYCVDAHTIMLNATGNNTVAYAIAPGTSLKFLPEALLPKDLEWAKPSQNVAEAFARFAAVIEEIGEQFLCENIRVRFQEEIKSWRGEDPGLSRQWVETAISGLDEEQQAIGRIALLTALSPYQVDQGVIKNYFEYHPDSEKLLGTVAWSSFSVARKIGTWLHAAIP